MNILIAGVGGQGSLLASRILGELFLMGGLDVKVSEVHGMSQRGGSVITHVRAGERVASPLVPKGFADLLIAFEQLEALRWIDYLKEDGAVVVNVMKILPMPVLTGAAEYPDKIAQKLMSGAARAVAADALEIARGIGSPRFVNAVMLGVASRFIDADEDKWYGAFSACVKPQFLMPNWQAFEKGCKV